MIETTNKKKELKNFQLLIEGPEKEYLDFGKMIAPASKLVQRENELGQLIVQEDLAEKNGTTVLSKTELRQELIKYNLAIVTAENYCGDFSIDYLKNVKDFLNEKKLSVSDYDLKQKLHTIYPKKHYRYMTDKDTTSSNSICYSSWMYNGNEETNPTILFEENGFFHVIHKGKNYKTLYNLRRGWFYSDSDTNVTLRILSVLLFSGLIFLITCPETTLLFFILYGIYNFIYTVHDISRSDHQFNDKQYKL